MHVRTRTTTHFTKIGLIKANYVYENTVGTDFSLNKQGSPKQYQTCFKVICTTTENLNCRLQRI